MAEIVLNLHIHTCYSDGSLSHEEIARKALTAGLDALMVTDHNVLVEKAQRYYQFGNKKILLMVGEEIHDQSRQPQKSHLLVFGARQDLACFAYNPQLLIDKVNQCGGICFLAHPFDPALPAFGEDDISWADWMVKGYTGLELWNGFSEFKVHVHSKIKAIFYAFFPQFMPHQPPQETLKIWDNLLNEGKKIVAIGGSDAHARQYHLGPLSRIIFPYEFHFNAINTHVIIKTNLNGNQSRDGQQILDGLKSGHCFIGYDLPASTRNFYFGVENSINQISMGDEIKFNPNIILKITIPGKCECRLIKNGEKIGFWPNHESISYSVDEPGVYRVECYRWYLGIKRGWIFSNPIYIR
jgi:hypothetical protein